MATEFKPAPEEVLATMDAVIDRHAKFADIRKHDLRIEVLMAWSDNDQPVKKHGAVAAACVKVVGGEERANGGPDVRIKVDAKRYGQLGPKSRQALFAHELYHLEFQYGDGGLKRDVYGRPVVKAIPDDYCINGFRQVAEWYGDNAVELRSYKAVGELLSQATLFDRPAPAERLADRLGHDVTVNGRPVETMEQLGEAIFPAEPAEAPQADPGEDVWRLLSLSSIASYGLTVPAIVKLQAARIDAVGALADAIEGGELAEAVPDLTDDEVDQVVRAHRLYRIDLPRLLAEARGNRDVPAPPADEPWRATPIDDLDLADGLKTALERLGHRTAGDLVDAIQAQPTPAEGKGDGSLRDALWTRVREAVERLRGKADSVAARDTGLRDGEHPLSPHLAEPKGGELDRDVWMLLQRVEWAHDSFYTNPVLKLPEDADEDLLKRADAAVARIGGEWAEDVKGYTFTLVRCRDALKAMLAARRAPTVWQDSPLRDVVPPSLAKRLAEVCGVHTAGHLDARVKTLHDQDTLADAAGVPRVDMADAIVLLEDWIKRDGRREPTADPAKIRAARERVEAIGKKPRAPKASKSTPVESEPAEPWRDLGVASLRVPGPDGAEPKPTPKRRRTAKTG